MKKYERIACVTGASGMVGSSIVRKLLLKEYKVRILTRYNKFNIPGTEKFFGGLDDESILSAFLSGADVLFHCAAELKDESKMWAVNVKGTERLMKLAKNTSLGFICFMSSVGVTGLTDTVLVDENTRCNPQNAYESSKLAAEDLVSGWRGNYSIVILRPTNVINDQKPGVLTLPIRNEWRDKLEVFIKGGESAHIIHADDVADAALFFLNTSFKKPECYIVSCDYDERNTYAGLWSLYNQQNRGKCTYYPQRLHLPTLIPHVLRSLKCSKVNKGNICYLSKKLFLTGFNFSLGVEGAVARIASYWKCTHQNVIY